MNPNAGSDRIFEGDLRPPHLRRLERPKNVRADAMLPIIFLCGFSCVYYGLRPALILLIAVGSAIGFEVLGCCFLRKKPSVNDGSAVVTGGIIGIVMSPVAPYWLPIAAAGFAILVVKLPFGGNGRNIFNPAAGGIALVTLCCPTLMFRYPDPSKWPVFIAQTSPAALLQAGGMPALKVQDLLLGNFAGPIGTVPVLLLLASALYLLVRRCVSLHTLVPYVAAVTALAVLFPRIGTGDWIHSIMMEMSSGYLLFAGIFMFTDPVTAPKHWLGRIFFGLLGGVLVMLLRYHGAFEEGCCFAVLLLNPFAPAMDRIGWRLAFSARRRWQRHRRRHIGNEKEAAV